MDRVYSNRLPGQRRIHIEINPTEIADLLDDLAWAMPYDHPSTDQFVELLLAAHSLFVTDQDDAQDAARQATAQPAADEQRVAELEAEIAQLHDKHKASLRRADQVNNELMQEVQRYAEGTERPVLWSVYNQMHNRALAAEAKLTAPPAAGLAVPTNHNTERTPCDFPPCEDGGEPCNRHEREESHADGEHELCGNECTARQVSELGAADRQFLTFALDLADQQMASRGNEFEDEDHAAIARLRRLAAGAES